MVTNQQMTYIQPGLPAYIGPQGRLVIVRPTGAENTQNMVYIWYENIAYLSADIMCSKIRTDDVQGQRCEHIFAPNWGCRVYPSNGLQRAWKKCSRSAWCLLRKVFSLECPLERLYKQKKYIPFFRNNHKTLSHLELNFKPRLIVVEVRFENCWISLRRYPRICSRFSQGIFGHLMHWDQSRASKIIWWIIA